MPSNFTFWPIKSKSISVFYDDSVIIWSKQNRNLEKECKIKILRNNSGSIIKMNENTYKWVDDHGGRDEAETSPC